MRYLRALVNNTVQSPITSTTAYSYHRDSIYDDDNSDIILPVLVGAFVALALGWMILRYTCSSKEQSPHNVRCCPESLWSNIRSVTQILQHNPRDRDLLRYNTDEKPSADERTARKSRSSDYSLSEISGAHVTYSPTLVQFSSIQRLSNNHAVRIHLTPDPTPTRHPLRRESVMNNDRRDSRRESMWPFKTNFNFHRQTSKQKDHTFFHG
ncbi:unnamed protein product [Didymodactylos carnosus]|uniref:Uncharacterized protein n=1 Tax=Didymodactylos carnosus TaxID=1234261 RepID=A0A815IKR0_9BILA|nr:unnamed protein product [Didymodactylos carnosus]CAF4250299.1 unnamed protein product [Didymodactylos carnosus]